MSFRLLSGAASKLRPALVLFDLPDDVIICRVTSIVYDGPYDVAINDWSSAGLLKPSVARLDRLLTAERRILLRKLGALSDSDTQTVRGTWNAAMRL